MRLGLSLSRSFQSFLQIRTKTSGRIKTHYDVLGIAANASQIDIKTAYYKLAKKYHPDKNRSQPSNQFMDISVAYEVLSNRKTKKTYDEDLLKSGVISDRPVSVHKVRYKERFETSKMEMKSVYNFDEWRQMHYTNAFLRKSNAQSRYREYLTAKSLNMREKQTAKAVMSVIGSSIVIYILFKHLFESNDSSKKIK